ncbi:hypothetical protein [Staphylococcus agnetis]|uniref:hypothetical protein n=1 Tax=Staphylococcus agnetis TaxID=985762 RepID=UPI0004E46441|nr:hypothetical protein SAGN_00645 [Staphylococcus agnetis]NJH66257.1 hypothetical protein [Staphylococcus agnetis]NJH98647.1 hypothetical protein [Staphylococcus agnetis]
MKKNNALILNIDKVVFEGYADEEESRFQELFEEMKSQLPSEIKQGVVPQEQFGLN